MPTSLGPLEILVILVVALIVLGPERLPKAARQIGKAVAEVRHWSSGIQEEVRDAFNTDSGPDRPPDSTAPVKGASAPTEPTAAAPDAPDGPSPN